MTSFSLSLFLFHAKLATAAPLILVDVGYSVPTPLPTQISTSVCAGLFNRNEDLLGPAYLLWDSDDIDWLKDVDGVEDPAATMSAQDFLALCLGPTGPAKGYLLYNATSQAVAVPNLITVAAVLDAIPLEADDPTIEAESPLLLFDSVAEWEGFSSLNATEYTFDHWGYETTTMAKMNPGYDQSIAERHPVNPPLTGSPNPRLIDFIVKEKLFNFFFLNGCIRGTLEYELEERMTTDPSTGWPQPVPVYGYDNSWPIAGDLFEAETDCNKEHNAGQIATSGVSNLAYFSRKPAITEPLPQNPASTTDPYDPTKTYLAITMGDGDNVRFVQTSRRAWMLDRVAKCEADPSTSGCFPLLWSISPHLLHLAPQWLQWYFNQSYATGSDYFVLPPSGDLYSYPGEMPSELQDAFVANTERDAELLSTSASVHWEWFLTWNHAISTVMPRYAVNQVVQSLYAVNVPFLLPMPEGLFGKGEHYRIIDAPAASAEGSAGGEGGKLVLFKPREWRGTSCTPAYNCPTAANLAAAVSNYPKGSVAHVYLTSDGGASIDDLYEMVGSLEDHVVLVDHQTLVDMALERG